MRMEFRKFKLSEITDSCLGKMLDQNKNKGEYLPYLANINVRWGAFDLMDLPQMRFEEKEQDRYGLKKGDLIVCEGGEPGRCAIWMGQLPNMKIQKALHRIRAKSDKVDYRWLFYWFLLAGKRHALEQYFTGATIKHLPGDKLKNITINLPLLKHQRRIADILSAYDDLIENNRKQIALLEEAAQRLYKEWFVDFRFPGHETAEWENGLPKGWQKKKLRDLIEYEIGGGWGEDVKTAKSEHPGYVIRGTDIDDINQGDFSGIPFRYHTKSNIESRILQDGDIVFEVSGGSKNIGVAKVLLITKEFLSYWNHPVICASFCKLIRFANHELCYHAYFAIKYWRSVGITGEYEKKSASSIINFRWQDFLDKQYLIIPSPEIHRKMLSWEKDIFDSIICREKQIQYLTTTRDSLLPKLMSGKIEVTA